MILKKLNFSLLQKKIAPWNYIFNNGPFNLMHGLRTPDEVIFSLKSRIFGLGQTNWADKFWGIWGIFGQTISTNFGTVSSLSMFSIIQTLFLQKTKPLYPHPKYLPFEFWLQRIRDLVFI